MPDALTAETCRECRKPILVCPYTPHEKAAEATGIAAKRMEYGTLDEDFVGWICLDCALESAHRKGGGTLAGGGPVGEWEFCY